MAEPYGAFALVLHSHIPYVLAHDRLEEEWLFEAVAESYLPLVDVLHQLIQQGISPHLTLGLTPVLLEQLTDSRFPAKFLTYLEQKALAAQEDRRVFQWRAESAFARLASLWETLYRRAAIFFQDTLAGDLIGPLRQMQAAGHIELMTSAATHAYLPLLGFDESVQAQIEIGTACYQRCFGIQPQGCWLPECGYRPALRWTPPLEGVANLPVSDRRAVDHMLAVHGIRYFIVDTPQLYASLPSHTRHAPLRLHTVDGGGQASSAALAVLTRDLESTVWVWQHDSGYPGDPWYLEFHKKMAGGLRYWRITDRRSDLAAKQRYIPEAAFGQVRAHALHFAQLLRERLRSHWEQTGELGVSVAAFDTELFGHWWFEGPHWISELVRQVTASAEITLATCSALLDRHPPRHTVQLVESSWGAGGDHRVWLQEETREFWQDLYQAEVDMQQLGAQLDGKTLDAQLRRILQQCGREFLLLQASDWPFMITNQSTPDHAVRRTALHRDNFRRFLRMAERYMLDEAIAEDDWQALDTMERQHPLFPDLDPNVFWQGKYHVSDNTLLSQEQRAASGSPVGTGRGQ